MKKEKKRNWYEEQKERREREQREKEAREQRRKAAQRRRAEQAGTGNGYAGVEKKTAEPWKSTAGTGKNQTDVAAEGVLPQGKRIRAEAAPTWVNTAGPGGGAELWKQVKLEPGETAADYYEKKRKQREADRQKTDAAFSRALEETQKELREQRLGVAEGFGRKKRYNRNYEDLFGLPEGGDFRSRVEGTRGWDKLNGSEQYDRMVYIQEELERRKKEREKEEEIGYNTINGRNKQRDVWNGQWPPRTMEHRAAEAEPQRRAGRETPGAVWSGPAIVKRPEEIPEDVWNGLDWRGRLSAAGRIEGAKQREAWIAGEREAANQPTTGRAGAELLTGEFGEVNAREPQIFQKEHSSHYGKAVIQNGLEADKYISLEESEQRDKSYDTLPEEMKELYDILGEATNDGYVMINGQKLKYDECLEYDSTGNIIPGEDGNPKLKEGYLKALQDEINVIYQDMDEKYKKRLLEATSFIIAQEGQKQNHIKTNPDKVLNITDKYNDEISGYMERPGAWIWDMLSEVGGTKVGVLNLKSNPESINKICEGQIPQQIMENALSIGGTEGVAYLQQEGYGYFQVGNRVMSAEELGNYTLGLIAEAKGYSPDLAYWAATTDNVKNRMMAGEIEAAWPENHVISGEMYDKYFQRMGVEDAWKWK